jgi:predicted AAA+ superfamily ATPase
MINRDSLIDLTEYLESFPAVMLTGPRQVGKTTLAHSLSEAVGRPVHYLDLENPEHLNILTNNANAYLMALKDHCVVIDEAQVLPALFTYLRPIIDAHRVPGRFILLGSANPMLVKGISETLAGRIYYLEIGQISLHEATVSGISFETHWYRGGFPEPLLAKSHRIWLAWMDGFVKSYIYRDINFLFGIDLSPMIIDRIWNMLAQLNGGIENSENLSRSLGISSNTVKKYIDFLEGAYLIHRLPAFFINNGKRLVKSSKIYLRTSGVLHYLLKINDFKALNTHPALGTSWEGYVLEQVHMAKPHLTRWYFYRTHNGAEVDLVLVQGGTPVACLEIKYTDAPTLSRGFYECIDDLKTTKNYVITPNSIRWEMNDKVTVCSLAHFLSNELPNLS